jgi:hypothetical protein
MDDYFSISSAISRSEQSGSVCDTLSLDIAKEIVFFDLSQKNIFVIKVRGG